MVYLEYKGEPEMRHAQIVIQPATEEVSIVVNEEEATRVIRALHSMGFVILREKEIINNNQALDAICGEGFLVNELMGD